MNWSGWTRQEIICEIANDGMWFHALLDLDRDTTGIPLADILTVDGNMANNRFECDPYLSLVRECQLVCMMELRKAGFSNAKIGEVMQCSDATVSKRIKRHMEATR